MWAALIPIILQLLQFLLPLFFKRLNEFVGKLDESKTARQMFRKANPTTFEEFQAIWQAICEQVVADAASRPQARRLESVKPRFLKPKFMRAAWTRLVATGKFPACTTAPDLSLNELIAESKED